MVCTEGKHSCCAVSWGGWRVGIPVCWTDGLTWRATDHAVTSSLLQHMWPADAKLGRKSLLKYLTNTLSCVFMPSLRVALHWHSLQCLNKLGWGAKIIPSYLHSPLLVFDKLVPFWSHSLWKDKGYPIAVVLSLCQVTKLHRNLHHDSPGVNVLSLDTQEVLNCVYIAVGTYKSDCSKPCRSTVKCSPCPKIHKTQFGRRPNDKWERKNIK